MPTWIRRPRCLMIVVLLAGSLIAGCSLEQLQIGEWYTIYTPSAGSCPGLRWAFFVDAQRKINGSVSLDAVRQVADLTGVLDPDDSFRMIATDQERHRTAEVTGRFTSLVSTIAIQGDGLSAGCDGQTFSLRLGGYFAHAGGVSTFDGGR